mgnify:CR=1 FL=1
MFLTGKPFQQGSLKIIAGPVSSGKTEKVEAYLDSLVDSGFKKDSNIVVARHPSDDKNPEHLGFHRTTVVSNADEIYDQIRSSTGTVIIMGASHFEDKNIVDLVDALVRSNRQVVLSGLNLTANGKPYGFMPEFMGLADEVELTKGTCTTNGCHDESANRSGLSKKEYLAVCAHHYSNPDLPLSAAGKEGSLELFVGSMFSGKSTQWFRKLRRRQKLDFSPIVFKYAHDDRYGEVRAECFQEGKITLHGGERVSAIAISTGDELRSYLENNPGKKDVFVDEGQFIAGLYDAVFNLIPRGYKFSGTGLQRGFNRKKFGDIPALMCLADAVNMNYAICVECGHPAPENQRMKRVNGGNPIPAHYHDPLQAVGGKDTAGVDYFYQARCLKDWVLDGEPRNCYELARFEWK